MTMTFDQAKWCAAAALLLVGGAACSDPETPETPYPDGGVMPTATTTATAMPTATATAAPTATATTPTTGPPTGPCDGTMQLALQTAIKERAKTEVSRSMKPESAFQCQVVNEGGEIQVPVTLQPGRCYSFLAHSFPNVTDIDVFLKPNFGPNPNPMLASFANVVLAQDSEQGPVASIGGGSSCYKNPLPVPGAAMVTVIAKQGGGPIAVQAYSK